MSDLIAVEKAGERLAIHPSTLVAHEAAGWSLSAEPIPEQEEPTGGDNGSGDGQVSETPDGVPTPIPADWRDMHHTKIIALAKELHGDFEATADKTMTERARSIIEEAEADRANPPSA